MSTRSRILHFLRQLHLYVGVFTAPAILFFAFTGVLQTFSLHETSRGSSYKPDQWIVVLAQIHKKQTPEVPVRKGPPKASGISSVAAKADTQPQNPPAPQPSHNPLPLKIFFLLVGAGLFASTLSGLYMSWRYKSSRLLLALLVAAGIVTPILMIVL
ncbi:MAG TPA: PepSY domain-containing protein [Terracidiphilus sp.]|jgi:hypothetical protein